MPPATDNSVQILSESKSNNYKVVAFALDLTGKKLIDEICHIAACHGASDFFEQYIMTYRDISRSSIRAHGIRIFTMFGKYRVLKDMNTMKTLHTKSEYSTLIDFMAWLEQQKGSSEGVILAYHDSGSDKLTPFLMEALERYKLTEQFFTHVKGFVNVSSVAATQPDIKGRSLTLRSLARRLLEDEKTQIANNNKEKETGSETDQSQQKTPTPEATSEEADSEDKTEKPAPTDVKPKEQRRRRDSRDKSRILQEKEVSLLRAKFRALTTYKLLQKFTTTLDDLFGDDLLKFMTTRDEEMKILERQRVLAAKVRSLRPIFVGRIRTSPRERSRAVLLRRYLIESSLDYDTLKAAYETGSNEAITKIVEETAAKKKKQHADELVEIIATHFKEGEVVKKDVNANEVDGGKKGGVDGAGDRNGDLSSSTESEDEEFEEAAGDN